MLPVKIQKVPYPVIETNDLEYFLKLDAARLGIQVHLYLPHTSLPQCFYALVGRPMKDHSSHKGHACARGLLQQFDLIVLFSNFS